MEPNLERSGWLAPLKTGTHACFFYTSQEEFLSISLPFLQESLASLRERTLWILPPAFDFQKAKSVLNATLSLDLEGFLKRKRLMLFSWDNWYRFELSIQDLLKQRKNVFRETLKAGFEGLRILSHSPSKMSAYWKDFLLYEETLSTTSFRSTTYLCGYSLIDCPAAAISSIASNHSHCLIHHGSEWEWLLNQTPVFNKSIAFKRCS